MNTTSEPTDAQAEEAVLGAALLSSRALDDASGIIAPKDFSKPKHEEIYTTMLGLWRDGKPTDPVSVAAALTAAGALNRVGGAAYLHTLLTATPTAANAAWYAQIVRERAAFRRIQAAAEKVGYASRDTITTAEELAAFATQQIEEATGVSVSPPSGVNFAEEFEAFIEEVSAPLPPTQKGITWGYLAFDQQADVRPMLPGQLVIIGARPKIGKSTFFRRTALDVALRQGKRVLIHSMEMSKQEVIQSLVACEAEVLLKNIQDHTLTEREHQKVAKMWERLTDSTLIIDDSPDVTLESLGASIRTWKPDIVILDYVQLMDVPGGRDARYQEVGFLSRQLKKMAGRYQTTIMACAQLNRDSTRAMGGDHRPRLEQLRESGSLEQDANTVILLHREDVYDAESPRAGEIDFIVAKQRNGQSDLTLTGVHQYHYGRFADLAPSYQPSAQDGHQSRYERGF